MKSNIYCTIMAGGQGNRLWPLSQPSEPKQFLDLVGVGRTMLQMTYDRFRFLCPPENFVVVTNANYIDIVHRQLPELPVENILCEPFRRNTAACIAYANSFIKQRDPEATVIVTPSDHLILNEQMFVDSVKKSLPFAMQNDVLLTIGVRAHKPETAFGYIQIGEPVKGRDMLYKVKTFTEKPDAEMAQIFYECGDFCWNTGVFVWKSKTIEAVMRRFMPNVQQQFDNLDSLPVSHWTAEAIQHAYEECENESIDYGVLEKADNVYVMQTEALWSDLGSWDAIYEQGRKDEYGNSVAGGKAVAHKTSGCLVHMPANKYCIVEGLKNYMVVERDNVLLICPRERSRSSWKYSAEISAEINK